VSTTNSPPSADAGDDQVITQRGTTVQLDGSASFDNDGDSLSYTWTMLEKPAESTASLNDPAAVNPMFVADVKGDYTVQLEVRDSNGAVSIPDTVLISFNNVPPVAVTGGNQVAVVGDEVFFDGTASYDGNFDPLSFRWSIVTAPSGSQATLNSSQAPQASVYADVAGLYVISLIVNDGTVDSAPENVQVMVVEVSDAAIDLLGALIDTVNELPSSAWKNDSLQKAFTNKLLAVIDLVNQNEYQQAMDKLLNDVLPKTDGYATGGAADKTDWITDTAAQDGVYGEVQTLLELLKRLVK